MTKEPATHKKEVLSHIFSDGRKLAVLEIGIRYHNNRYTPETAYFVSLNGYGQRFTGKTSNKRALACYNATLSHIQHQLV